MLILRVSNGDQFSLPVLFEKCIVTKDGKDAEMGKYASEVGNVVKAKK